MVSYKQRQNILHLMACQFKICTILVPLKIQSTASEVHIYLLIGISGTYTILMDKVVANVLPSLRTGKSLYKR